MPGIFDRRLARRQFLWTSATSVAALILGRRSRIMGAESAATGAALRFALLSDTHIPADAQNQYRGFYPVKNLEAILPGIIETAPAGVIVCGDAARLSGELADYEALKRLLVPVAEKAPVYVTLGNHDNRDNFFKVFNRIPGDRQTVTGKHVVVLEQSGLRMILLDSLLYVNQVAGLLGKAQREWLARFLTSADGRPTVLFVHHTLGDGDGELLDVDRLLALVQPHRQVKAIFYGHSHVWEVSERQGLHLINLPAVGYNFRDQDPVGWVDARFTAAGVDLTLHALAGNRAEDDETRSLIWS
jgi:3',5'-cyclic AMP phosphodiesterase CpdA